MNFGSALAVYFIIWWVCLFAVLPFGVRNSHEAGEAVEEGNDPGAPVNPMLLRKAVHTTILATVLFGLIYAQIVYGIVKF